MFNSILNAKLFFIPISVTMLYTIYKQHNELKHIKKQLIKLSKRVLQLEILKKETEIFYDKSSHDKSTNTISEISDAKMSVSEMSVSEMSVSVLTIDTALANSTSNINTLETNTSTNNDDERKEDNPEIKDVHEHEHEYEYIEHNNDTKILNNSVNRKKSNSITDVIWAGITDNIIYF